MNKGGYLEGVNCFQCKQLLSKSQKQHFFVSMVCKEAKPQFGGAEKDDECKCVFGLHFNCVPGHFPNDVEGYDKLSRMLRKREEEAKKERSKLEKSKTALQPPKRKEMGCNSKMDDGENCKKQKKIAKNANGKLWS